MLNDVSSRRRWLQQAGAGFGSVALSWLAHQQSFASATDVHSFRTPHEKGTAKSVIFLFMEGGPSHIDLFDPKPVLNKIAGKPLPESFGKVITSM